MIQSPGEGQFKEQSKGMEVDTMDDMIVNLDESLISDGISTTLEPPPSEVSEEKAVKIIKDMNKSVKGKIPDTLLGAAVLLQRGATSVRAPEEQGITIRNTHLRVGDIRKACRKETVTVRQFARGMKNRVIQIMDRLGPQAVPENLAKKYLLDNPGATREELT